MIDRPIYAGAYRCLAFINFTLPPNNFNIILIKIKYNALYLWNAEIDMSEVKSYAKMRGKFSVS